MLAAEDKTGSGVTAPSAHAEPVPETTSADVISESVVGKVEASAAVEKSGSWKIISVVAGLAVVAAGFAICKKIV